MLTLVSEDLGEGKVEWTSKEYEGRIVIITQKIGNGKIEIFNKYTPHEIRKKGLMTPLQRRLYGVLLEQGCKSCAY